MSKLKIEGKKKKTAPGKFHVAYKKVKFFSIQIVRGEAKFQQRFVVKCPPNCSYPSLRYQKNFMFNQNLLAAVLRMKRKRIIPSSTNMNDFFCFSLQYRIQINQHILIHSK